MRRARRQRWRTTVWFFSLYALGVTAASIMAALVKLVMPA